MMVPLSLRECPITIENNMKTIGKDATISRVIDKFEGGYVNNPNDSGGATNMGITLATFRSVNPLGNINDIKSLKKEQAIAIYTDLYWNKYHIDKMPEAIQDVVFDTYVQHSPVTAGKIIQRALVASGKVIVVDGEIGDNTLKAINSLDGDKLRASILLERKRYYENRVVTNPTQAQFLKGWLNRLEALI